MRVFRLSKKKHASDLTGAGAEKYGGRWNNPGTAIIYTCESRALCAAEIAVHTPFGILPVDYMLITIDIPGHAIHILNYSQWPDDWKSIPPSPSTKALGDQFALVGKWLGLKVPSVIVPDEFNILLNPRHPRIKELKIIKVESFSFDTRLFDRS